MQSKCWQHLRSINQIKGTAASNGDFNGSCKRGFTVTNQLMNILNGGNDKENNLISRLLSVNAP